MKRFFSMFAVVMLILGSFVLPAFADGAEEIPVLAPAGPFYLSFTGTVTDLRPAAETGAEGKEAQYVRLENAEDAQMDFLVDADTLLLNAPLLENGQQLIGFYDGNRPAVLIYPPQQPALVLAPYVEAEQMVMAYFDADLLSDDGMLQLTLDSTTEVLDQAGVPYEGTPGEQVLVVSYGPSTRSIPAQTTPVQIVVMESLTPAPAGETAE